MTDDSPVADDHASPDSDVAEDFKIPRPLSPELGDLANTVTWWVESHRVTDPATAPAATLNDTFTIEALDAPECVAFAAAVCGLLTSSDPAQLTAWTRTPDGALDHSASLNHSAWMQQCAAIRDHMFTLRPLRTDAPGLRDALPEVMRSLVDRLASDDSECMVVDGPVAAGALLLAYELNPGCLVRIRPLQRGQSPVEAAAWDYLRVSPVVPMTTGYSNGELANVAVTIINLSLELATRP